MKNLVLATIGFFLCASGTPDLHAQQPPRTLLRADLAGVPDPEIIIQAVDIPPGGATPWHIHPGGHEIAFVLEGETAAEIEGEAARSARSGELIHVLPNVPHMGRNSSNAAPLRLLVIRIKDKAQPLMVPVKR